MKTYMLILFMHCCFTQEDKRAFKAIPAAESIYASLSEEMLKHVLLSSFSHARTQPQACSTQQANLLCTEIWQPGTSWLQGTGHARWSQCFFYIFFLGYADVNIHNSRFLENNILVIRFSLRSRVVRSHCRFTANTWLYTVQKYINYCLVQPAQIQQC